MLFSISGLLFQLTMMNRITNITNRALQFGRKVWIVGILLISIILSIEAIQETSSCQLFMCIKPDSTAAVATVENPSTQHIIAAQDFISSSNIMRCYIDCDGPYNAYKRMAYWSWKECGGNVVGNGIWDFTCDASILKVCEIQITHSTRKLVTCNDAMPVRHKNIH